MAKKETKKKICFAVTPIGEEGSEIRRRSDQVLRYIIEPVMVGLGYETVRADLISQPGMITNQIVGHLIDDNLVVADLTGSNPNVFYEVAIRHAFGRPIVTMIESGERIPFDVNQARTIHFTYRDLDSVDACKNDLTAQVRALEDNPSDFFTPVSVAVDLKAMYESGNPEERREAQVLDVLQKVQAEMSQLRVEVARLRDSETSRYPLSVSPQIYRGHLLTTGGPGQLPLDTTSVPPVSLITDTASSLSDEVRERIVNGALSAREHAKPPNGISQRSNAQASGTRGDEC